MNATDALGGALPVTTEEFAKRAYAAVLNPSRNHVKELMVRCSSVEETPPLLGIFNDIPWFQFRESEAHAWARAGFSWIVNDAEHCQWQGYYGHVQTSIQQRLGLLPVQRLHREAISRFGDAYQLGARATMRPYGTTYEEAEQYLQAISFPEPGKPTPHNRGGYPVRAGDRRMMFTPEDLLKAERDTQGWLQFETAEYILNKTMRDRVLDLMAVQGPHRVCGFVGPFDVILRQGDIPEINSAINELFRAAAAKGIHMGRVVGSGSIESPRAIEDAIVEAVENGARLISVHYMTSDLTYRGAAQVAEPFFRACERCGF